jgi:hypothetical protein
MKALIIACPRSGTSLSLRILKNHPKIEKVFFESKLLRSYQDKKQLIQFHFQGLNMRYNYDLLDNRKIKFRKNCIC